MSRLFDDLFSDKWQNESMDKTIPKGRIAICLHQLYIEIEHDASYPDQLTDMSNRALQILTSVLSIAKESGLDIRQIEFEEEDEEE